MSPTKLLLPSPRHRAACDAYRSAERRGEREAALRRAEEMLRLIIKQIEGE